MNKEQLIIIAVIIWIFTIILYVIIFQMIQSANDEHRELMAKLKKDMIEQRQILIEQYSCNVRLLDKITKLENHMNRTEDKLFKQSEKVSKED